MAITWRSGRRKGDEVPLVLVVTGFFFPILLMILSGYWFLKTKVSKERTQNAVLFAIGAVLLALVPTVAWDLSGEDEEDKTDTATP